MSGFLPLIEAFVAFALTMMVLTAAVSAFVGIIHRLLRTRAQGLRDTMEYLFRNSIRSMLDNAGKPKETDWELDEREFIVDMTMPPRPVAATNSATDARLQFVAPTKTDGTLREAWRHWHTLRRSLDYLSEDDFQNRLDTSAAGQFLKAERGAGWTDVVAELTRMFTSYGVSATEMFTRLSRILTVTFGFLLAVGLNIDSVNLLSTYLSDPVMRQAIVSDSEQLIGSATAGPVSLPRPEDVKNHNDQVTEALAAFGETAEQFRNAANSMQSIVAVEEVRSAIELATIAQLGLEELQTDLAAAGDAANEISSAYREMRVTAIGLTETFPIGWNRFPNCGLGAPDARCAALRTSGVAIADSGFFMTIGSVGSSDTPGFIKWLAGILLTGALLGLGTPFWVKVVKGGLEAMDYARRGSKPASDATPQADSGAPSAAQSATLQQRAITARRVADSAPTT